MANVRQRVSVKHDQISQLANFELAEFLRQANRFCTKQRRRTQHIVTAHSFGQSPHFPMDTQTLQFSMAAYADAATGF